MDDITEKDMIDYLPISYFILHQMITLNQGFLQSYERYVNDSNSSVRFFKSRTNTSKHFTLPNNDLHSIDISIKINKELKNLLHKYSDNEKIKINKIANITKFISYMRKNQNHTLNGGNKCILCQNCNYLL